MRVVPLTINQNNVLGEFNFLLPVSLVSMCLKVLGKTDAFTLEHSKGLPKL